MFVRNDRFIACTVACSVMMTGAVYGQNRRESMNIAERKIYQKEIQLNGESPRNQSVSVDYRFIGGIDPNGSHKAFSDDELSSQDEMNLYENRY
ncbi:MAG: hypothetical protein AB1454_12805 [Candidatus Auribacterota bacterium]